MAETGLAPEADRHALYEDVLAIGLATLFLAMGVMLYARAQLVVGGTAGMALLLQYATGSSFWLLFSVLNLPFYALALWRMGWAFALRTAIAVSLVSLFAALLPRWIGIAHLDPLLATILGGGLMGTGLLMLFRHRTALGGLNILALYLQEKLGWRAGYVQLAHDLVLLAASALVLGPANLALSVLGAGVINMILAINHRPGRYLGMS
jgi:uncharacterized membrane-anchored protein YitT (DUF2179 family)